MTVGNVLEPVIFGRSMALHPVVVLLALMFWGALWGVTGVVIAVPLTAVARIHLSHIDHPLPRYFASVLVGSRAARLRAGVVPAPAVAPERVPLVSQQASGDHDDDQNFP
jgi:AI-2 transport protein TqsA